MRHISIGQKPAKAVNKAKYKPEFVTTPSACTNSKSKSKISETHCERILAVQTFKIFNGFWPKKH